LYIAVLQKESSQHSDAAGFLGKLPAKKQMASLQILLANILDPPPAPFL
jgi:hypothetical protein